MTMSEFRRRTGGLSYTKSQYRRTYSCDVPGHGGILSYSVGRLCQRVLERQARMARDREQAAQNQHSDINHMGVSLV